MVFDRFTVHSLNAFFLPEHSSYSSFFLSSDVLSSVWFILPVRLSNDFCLCYWILFLASFSLFLNISLLNFIFISCIGFFIVFQCVLFWKPYRNLCSFSFLWKKKKQNKNCSFNSLGFCPSSPNFRPLGILEKCCDACLLWHNMFLFVSLFKIDLEFIIPVNTDFKPRAKRKRSAR